MSRWGIPSRNGTELEKGTATLFGAHQQWMSTIREMVFKRRTVLEACGVPGLIELKPVASLSRNHGTYILRIMSVLESYVSQYYELKLDIPD
jgi:hypothetical protein